MCVSQVARDVGVLQCLEGRERRGRVQVCDGASESRGIDLGLRGELVPKTIINTNSSRWEHERRRTPSPRRSVPPGAKPGVATEPQFD